MKIRFKSISFLRSGNVIWLFWPRNTYEFSQKKAAHFVNQGAARYAIHNKGKVRNYYQAEKLWEAAA